MPADATKTVTRGEQMLALRKRRMAATHPFLRGGFRPFFFGAATWGLIALILWLCSLAGQFQLPSAIRSGGLAPPRNAVRLRRRCGERISADRNPELDRTPSDRGEATARAVRFMGGGATCRILLIPDRSLARRNSRCRPVCFAGRARCPRSDREQEAQHADCRHSCSCSGLPTPRIMRELRA